MQLVSYWVSDAQTGSHEIVGFLEANLHSVNCFDSRRSTPLTKIHLSLAVGVRVGGEVGGEVGCDGGASPDLWSGC
eukprot:3004960-Rhodomonas_salina.1